MTTTPKKPFARILHTPDSPHGVAKKMVIRPCPRTGLMQIKEHGRRWSSAVTVSISGIYVYGMKQKIAAERQCKKKR